MVHNILKLYLVLVHLLIQFLSCCFGCDIKKYDFIISSDTKTTIRLPLHLVTPFVTIMEPHEKRHNEITTSGFYVKLMHLGLDGLTRLFQGQRKS